MRISRWEEEIKKQIGLFLFVPQDGCYKGEIWLVALGSNKPIGLLFQP